MMNSTLLPELTADDLAAFCRRYQITELALFGSVVRQADFRADSDVDFLVTYAPEKRWAAWGDLPEADEMAARLGRRVDWITRRSVEQGRNPLFRDAVLSSAQVVYAEHG